MKPEHVKKLLLTEIKNVADNPQGYKVNLIQDNNGDEKLNEGVVSEKIAVFVSNGIRYTLKGRVSVDTMK